MEIPRSKVAIGLAILAAIGWLVFASGFGKHEHDRGHDKFKLQSSAFVFYGLAFAGIPTILLTLLYCFRPKKWLGGIALFCNIFMLICAGGVLTTTGNRISECMHGSSSVSTCMFHGGGGHSNASFSATAALVDASASLMLGNTSAPTTAPTPPPTKGPSYQNAPVEPYEQAEFAGTFIFTLFQTVSLCMLFWNAHGDHDGYTPV